MTDLLWFTICLNNVLVILLCAKLGVTLSRTEEIHNITSTSISTKWLQVLQKKNSSVLLVYCLECLSSIWLLWRVVYKKLYKSYGDTLSNITWCSQNQDAFSMIHTRRYMCVCVISICQMHFNIRALWRTWEIRRLFTAFQTVLSDTINLESAPVLSLHNNLFFSKLGTPKGWLWLQKTK